MQAFAFEPCELPPGADALRTEVRAFLDAEAADILVPARARSWVGFDAEFSRKLGARRWLGMTWPAPYGLHAAHLNATW